jgi:trigger factor
VQLSARGQRVMGVSLPDLGESLVGKSAGQSIRAEGEVAEDDERAELRGKKASFEIKVLDVKRLRLPELDAEMLAAIGFESEKDLRSWVRLDMESRLEEALREGLRNQMVGHLLSATTLDLPEQLSARQAERATRRKLLELFQRGVPETEINKHLDELRTTVQKEAVDQLKLGFVIEKISEEWDMQVSEEEVNARIAQIAARYHRRFDRVRDELSKGDGLTSLYLQLRDEKVLDRLIEQAEIAETEEPAKKPARAKAGAEKKSAGAAAKKEPEADDAEEGETKTKAKSVKKSTKKTKKSE